MHIWGVESCCSWSLSAVTVMEPCVRLCEIEREPALSHVLKKWVKAALNLESRDLILHESPALYQLYTFGKWLLEFFEHIYKNLVSSEWGNLCDSPSISALVGSESDLNPAFPPCEAECPFGMKVSGMKVRDWRPDRTRMHSSRVAACLIRRCGHCLDEHRAPRIPHACESLPFSFT